jgi:hypothetical protein
VAAPQAQNAVAKKRDQRSVVRQDAELALASGHDHLVDVALEGLPFRSHDFEV